MRTPYDAAVIVHTAHPRFAVLLSSLLLQNAHGNKAVGVKSVCMGGSVGRGTF